MPYERFLQQRVFSPLDMSDTTFYPDRPQRQRMARLYDPKGGKLVDVGFPLLGPADNARFPIPAGGLYSTGADLARLCQMMLCRGQLQGKRILSEASVRKMTALQTGDLPSVAPGVGYGLGWYVVRQPLGAAELLSPGTFGHDGAFSTQYWIDPKRDLFFIFLIQRASMPGGENFRHAAGVAEIGRRSGQGRAVAGERCTFYAPDCEIFFAESRLRD